ncbi:MAG: RusA family crossover junction endodeoxyribonuclease [Patescibacteria group bacterium]|nr:RusA family crossover junction endodeoxyribonuclease [Patescibacteria group bacterium]MDE2438748.1 RusA family crossover junction endodeoxyribonuclease [Patescibacteria group bacterium]
MILIYIPRLEPVSWKSHAGWGARSYNPRALEKETVQLHLRNFYKEEPIDFPVKVHFEFYFSMPKHFSKKKQKDALDDIIRPLRKDCTNLQKFTEDCLKGIVIKDDDLVCEISSKKFYREIPGIYITVEKLNSEE